MQFSDYIRMGKHHSAKIQQPVIGNSLQIDQKIGKKHSLAKLQQPVCEDSFDADFISSSSDIDSQSSSSNLSSSVSSAEELNFIQKENEELKKQREQEKKKNMKSMKEFKICLLLGDHNEEIRIPTESIAYEIDSQHDYEDEGPFAVIQLAKVKNLIQEKSAFDSQDIRSVRYNEPKQGIWKDFPTELEISYQILLAQDPNASDQFFRLRLTVDGFKIKSNLGRSSTNLKMTWQPSDISFQSGSSGSLFKSGYSLKEAQSEKDKKHEETKGEAKAPIKQKPKIFVALKKQETKTDEPVNDEIKQADPKKEETKTRPKINVQVKNKEIKTQETKQEKSEALEVPDIVLSKVESLSIPIHPQLNQTQSTSSSLNTQTPLKKVKPKIGVGNPIKVVTFSKEEIQFNELPKPNPLVRKDSFELDLKILNQMKEEKLTPTIITKPSIIKPIAMRTSKSIPEDPQNKHQMQLFEANKPADYEDLRRQIDDLRELVKDQAQIIQKHEDIFSLIMNQNNSSVLSQGQSPYPSTDTLLVRLSSSQIVNQNYAISQAPFSGMRDRKNSVYQADPDIMFVYADIMQRKSDSGDFVSIAGNQMLAPDLMYENILRTIEGSNLRLTVERKPINYKEFQRVLSKKLKVLFLLCHGDAKRKPPYDNFFCLEDVDDPTVMDEFSEERLRNLKCKIQCDVIVISACHSSRLATILMEGADKKINTVIAINSEEKLLEKAAQNFNESFLEQLLGESTVNDAFTTALSTVAAGVADDCKVCCCMHDHKDDCLWRRYREKYGEDKAHELHTAKCRCFSTKVKINDHDNACQQYKKFQEALQNTDAELYIKNLNNPSFAQFPNDKSKRYIMCCCSSELAHDESQKFVIMGAKDKKVFDKSRYGQGAVNQIKTDFSRIQLPEESMLDYSWRQKEKIQIIQFLLTQNHRILQIFGNDNISMDPVVRAVKYAAERDTKNNFKDGAIRVDVDGFTSLKEILRKIFKQMQQIWTKEPEEQDIINEFRKQTNSNKSFLIIFDNFAKLRDQNENTNLTRFLCNLIEETNKMKIMVITKTKEDFDGKKIDQKLKRLEWKALTKDQLIQIMNGLLSRSNKKHLVSSIALNKHAIFQLELGIRELQLIVEELDRDNDLDDIYKRMKTNLEDFKRQSSETIIDKNILSHLNQNRLLQATKSKTLINFIFFLAQIPRGLCLCDLYHLQILEPTFFSSGLGLLEIINNMENPNEEQNTKEPEKNRVKEAIECFIQIDKINELKSEQLFTIKKEQRAALDYLLKAIPKNEIPYESEETYFKLAVKFLTLYGSKLLTKIVQKRRQQEVDHEFLTLHLDQGMWTIMPNHLTDKFKNIQAFIGQELDMNEDRFNTIDHSFMVFSENQQKLQNCLGSLEKSQDFLPFIKHLAKLLPSLLFETGRVEEALEKIRDIKTFAKSLVDEVQHSLIVEITLIEVSLQIKQANNKRDGQAFQLQIKQILKEARFWFNQQVDANSRNEGIAESYFLEALLANKITAQNDTYLNRQNSMALPKYMDQTKLSKEVSALDYGLLKHSTSLMNEREKPYQLMKSAMKEFLKLSEQKVNKFGLAKTHMLFAEFYLNEFQDKDNQFKVISSEKKQQIIKHAQKAMKEFEEQKKYTQQLICSLIIAKTQMQGQHTQEERDQAYQTIFDLQADFKKHSIIDQVLQAEILDFRREVLREYRSEEGSLRFYNNAKSFPIVEQDQKGNILPIITPIKNNFKSNIAFRRPFTESKHRFQFKLDVLTEEIIEEAMRYGMRILHLTSDFDGTDGLCVEKENGVRHVLSPEDLKKILQSVQQEKKQSSKCKIKLVVLLIPKGEKIAQVFSDIGVDHVVAFESTVSTPQLGKTMSTASQKEIRRTTLYKLQFNYIFAFSVELYKNLSNQSTARQSFEKACETVNDDFLRNLYAQPPDLYYLHSKLLLSEYEPIENIQIKPLFLQPNSSVDSDIIFNKEQAEKGFIQDKYKPPDVPLGQQVQYLNCSLQVGVLANFSVDDNDYFGHMEDLYKMIKWLTDKTHPNPIVHVRGIQSVGKTRFIKQVGKFFYQRGMFPFKISYNDLLLFQTLDEFKRLLEQMDADLKASQEYEVNEDEFNDFLLNENTSNNRDILWLFDNTQSLSKQFWEQLEPKLYKLCNHKNIKVILASTDTIVDQLQKPNFDFKSFEIHNSNDQSKIEMQEIILQPLTPDQAVYMLFDNVQREIAEEELDPKTKSKSNVRSRIELELSFIECENLPGKIFKMAKKLQKKSETNKDGGGKLLSDLRAETLARIKRQEVKEKKSKSQEEQKELHKTISQSNKRLTKSGTIFISKAQQLMLQKTTVCEKPDKNEDQKVEHGFKVQPISSELGLMPKLMSRKSTLKKAVTFEMPHI